MFSIILPRFTYLYPIIWLSLSNPISVMYPSANSRYLGPFANVEYIVPVWLLVPFPKSSNPAPIGSPPSENADCVLPYTICKNNSLIAVFIASHTKSVFNASSIVFPTNISPAIAAECVIPEHPIVSTKASWIIPSLTFSVNLQAPC